MINGRSEDQRLKMPEGIVPTLRTSGAGPPLFFARSTPKAAAPVFAVFEGWAFGPMEI